MINLRRIALIGIALLIGALPQMAWAKRVALIIGNSDYAAVPSLTNPASDARLIAATLQQSGFDSVDVRYNLGKTDLDNALKSFAAKAEGADVAMVYYAGHGMEAGGQNFLIPSDARLLRDRDVEVEATRLDTVLLMMEGARLRVVVLDACRNNPFAASMQRSLRTRAVGRGLAAIEPEGETLVVYAAKAGSTASDGSGANSPFAEALAGRLRQPGLEIGLLFRNVRDDVLAKTGREQEPFTYGSLSGESFYFNPPGRNGAGQEASRVAAQPQAKFAAPDNSADGYYARGLADYEGGRFATSKDLLENGCRMNSGGACELLAQIYKAGRGTAKDVRTSLALFKKACDLRTFNGCIEAGLMYAYPNATGAAAFLQGDQKVAFDYFKIACEGGSPAGCTNFAYAFESGSGVIRNLDRARLHYTQACGWGEPTGCKRLVNLFKSGLLPQSGMADALELARKACHATPTSADCKELGLQ